MTIPKAYTEKDLPEHLSPENLMGVLYIHNGKDTDEKLVRAEHVYKKLGDKKYISISYHSIGGIHHSKGENDKAIEYYQKALIIAEERDDKMGIGYGLLNIAVIFEYNAYQKKVRYPLKYNLKKGTHTLYVQASDRAGNLSIVKGDFYIK